MTNDLQIPWRHEADQRAAMLQKAERAVRIWNESKPVEGTLAETYLRNRGITCLLPLTLRFHPCLWHGPSASSHPALVAHVQGAQAFAIHRTWIAMDGLRKADLDPAKAMLGPTRGGVVYVTEDLPGTLLVAEGIETALSMASGLCHFANCCVAALSTSGLRAMRLPSKPDHLVIARDGDPPGRAAAVDLATRAHALGWRVSFLDPPEGRDFNDVLMEKK